MNMGALAQCRSAVERNNFVTNGAPYARGCFVELSDVLQQRLLAEVTSLALCLILIETEHNSLVIVKILVARENLRGGADLHVCTSTCMCKCVSDPASLVSVSRFGDLKSKKRYSGLRFIAFPSNFSNIPYNKALRNGNGPWNSWERRFLPPISLCSWVFTTTWTSTSSRENLLLGVMISLWLERW